MNIVYYTSGTTGSGRVVQGISIALGLRRKNIKSDFTILHFSKFGKLAERFGIQQVEIPVEHEDILTKDDYQYSILYNTISSLNPDILIVDLMWFTLHNFIRELPCKKIFLCRQVHDRFFSVPLAGGTLSFRYEDYDLVLATEPFRSLIPMKSINPIIIRNREEIYPREKSLKELKLSGIEKNCLLSIAGNPEESRQIQNECMRVKKDGYHILSSSNYGEGFFPIVDYFNAFDLVICIAGYNSFWEAVYFDKKAIFFPMKRNFEDQERRVKECRDYRFDENGADQLVDIIANL